jgi:hypothetical protein
MTDIAKADDAGDTPAQDTRELPHTMGGSTTRDDLLDAGVPMLPGSPKERVGPEDALGEGPKRGDYTGRVDPNAHESVPNPKAGQPILGPDGQVLDFEPHSVLVAQAPRAEDIGDAAGKGGVDTATR